MSSVLGTAYVRLRPELSSFSSEATAGIKASLTETQDAVRSSARANVASAGDEVAANRALAASYAEIASAASKGSDEQLVAAKLARDATAATLAQTGQRELVPAAGIAGLLGFKRAASDAEQEVGKFSRGLVSGSGLAEHFGRSLAFASGGFLVFAGLSSTLHSALTGAAAVQKSTEAIDAGFGAAADSVTKFGEAAAGLGAHTDVVDQTSARFAILFKNLGVGQTQAAAMTKGFEQLAISVSAIKGVDPTPYLQSVVLAAAGNTRGLKQLGVAIDATQLKYAAFKLGLISTVNQALTPAIKAQAIYALATANLGQFQDQAAQHASDFANVQLRLSAEWTNAKDILGNALLPVFTQYATELANWLQRMSDTGRLQRDFNSAVGTARSILDDAGRVAHTAADFFRGFSDAVGGAKNAIELLIALKLAGTISGWAGGFSKLIGGPSAGIEGATTRSGLLLKNLKGLAGLGAITVGVDLLLKATGDKGAKGLLESVFGAGLVGLGVAGPEGAVIAITADVTFVAAKKLFSGDTTKIAEGLAKNFTTGIKPGFTVNTDAITSALGVSIREFGKNNPLTKELQDVLKTAAVEIGKSGVARITAAQVAAIDSAYAQLVDAANAATSKTGATADKALSQYEALVAKLKAAGVTGAQITETPISDATEQAAANAAKVKAAYDAVEKANAAGIQSMKDGLSQLHASLKDAISAESTDLANAVESAKSNLESLGQGIASSIGSVLEQPLTNLQNKLQEASDKRSLENLRRSVLLPGGKELSTDPNRAIAQLKQLAASASTITKASIQDFLVQYQQAALQVKQDQVSQKTNVAQRTVADLTDALERGQITGKQFNARLLALLKSDGVSYRKAGSLLGSAFENGFRDSVKGILAQAQALAAVPGRAGFTDPATKIVRPLDVLHKDQQEAVHIQAQIRDKHGALLAKIAKTNAAAAKAADKTAATLAAIASVNVGTPKSRNKGKQSGESTALTGTRN